MKNQTQPQPDKASPFYDLLAWANITDASLPKLQALAKRANDEHNALGQFERVVLDLLQCPTTVENLRDRIEEIQKSGRAVVAQLTAARK